VKPGRRSEKPAGVSGGRKGLTARDERRDYRAGGESGKTFSTMEQAMRLRCIRCGGLPAMLGLFIPKSFGPYFYYALCEQCFPPTPATLHELEQRFFADPAFASYLRTGGSA
jgi:hypothetical protein